ncbi:MAG: DUF4058 family protein, partial [Anaerolineae bacterium]
RPGVAVIGKPAPQRETAPGVQPAEHSGALVVEIPLPEEVRQRYLEIRDVDTEEVVTVIEVLSPSNKRPGEGRTLYPSTSSGQRLRKRRQVLALLTGLVEINLLRAGQPMPLSQELTSDYYILVSRGWERPRALLFPFSIREAIPEVPIPLRQGEEEPILDLNTVLHDLYDRARFDLRIDYQRLPDPPFAPNDAEWAAALLHQAGAEA